MKYTDVQLFLRKKLYADLRKNSDAEREMSLRDWLDIARVNNVPCSEKKAKEFFRKLEEESRARG